MGRVQTSSDVDFAISPFNEAVAYETLMNKYTNVEIYKHNFEGIRDFNPTEILDKFTQGKQILILDDFKADKSLNDIRDLLLTKRPFLNCTPRSYHYPQRLKDAKHPLKLFYYLGDIGLLETGSVSVVGSRLATPAGLKNAQKITNALVEANLTIVSGLAKGVDTVALKTATNHKQGRAIAVIGTPIDQYYPQENRELQDLIANKHLLISHVPFYRYAKEPFKNKRLYFPQRNVTMSAISQATVIVEASSTSGTRSQAEAAIHQGRKLFIMAGCFAQSSWPTSFLAKGAIKIKDEKDLLTQLKK